MNALLSTCLFYFIILYPFSIFLFLFFFFLFTLLFFIFLFTSYFFPLLSLSLSLSLSLFHVYSFCELLILLLLFLLFPFTDSSYLLPCNYLLSSYLLLLSSILLLCSFLMFLSLLHICFSSITLIFIFYLPPSLTKRLLQYHLLLPSPFFESLIPFPPSLPPPFTCATPPPRATQDSVHNTCLTIDTQVLRVYLAL